jgi:hypothetical protein
MICQAHWFFRFFPMRKGIVVKSRSNLHVKRQDVSIISLNTNKCKDPIQKIEMIGFMDLEKVTRICTYMVKVDKSYLVTFLLRHP